MTTENKADAEFNMTLDALDTYKHALYEIWHATIKTLDSHSYDIMRKIDKLDTQMSNDQLRLIALHYDNKELLKLVKLVK